MCFKYVNSQCSLPSISANEIPEKYGYGVRHMQALLIFGCLTCTMIARAHISVTIVAMANIPKHNNVTVLNNSDIYVNNMTNDLSNTTYTSAYQSLYKNVEIGIANSTQDGRKEFNLEIKDNGTEVISSIANGNKTSLDNIEELEDVLANKPNSSHSVWNVYRVRFVLYTFIHIFRY